MAKKKTEPVEKIEREYIIPLRHKWKKVPRYKRANKAIKAIKEFLVRHMEIRDRDLNKVKLDKYLNEFIWTRGIRKPPIKIKVKAIKEEGNLVRVELSEMPEKMKFKQARIEKMEKKAAEIGKKKKKEEKLEEKTVEKKEEKTEEEKKEEKEKAKAGEEAGKELGKAAAKQIKHHVEKIKQPKRQQRKALAK
jgi:large subunit ribosomal protein L31e